MCNDVATHTEEHDVATHTEERVASTPHFLEEGMRKLMTQNALLMNKVVKVESITSLLERRVKVLEDTVFELKDWDRKFEELKKFVMDRIPTATEQTPLPAHSPAHAYTAECIPNEEPSKVDEVTDDGDASFVGDATPVFTQEACDASTGIAKRVHARDNRKRKAVSTSFTTFSRRKKQIKNEEAVSDVPVIDVRDSVILKPHPAPTQINYPGRLKVS